MQDGSSLITMESEFGDKAGGNEQEPTLADKNFVWLINELKQKFDEIRQDCYEGLLNCEEFRAMVLFRAILCLGVMLHFGRVQ